MNLDTKTVFKSLRAFDEEVKCWSINNNLYVPKHVIAVRNRVPLSAAEVSPIPAISATEEILEGTEDDVFAKIRHKAMLAALTTFTKGTGQ